MNAIAKAILISTALTLPALSGNAYSHQQGNNSGGSMMGGMMMGPQMMGQEMMNMREQMQENHSIMGQIRDEKSTDKRNELMQQHMNSMQEQMQMMNKTIAISLKDNVSLYGSTLM